MQVNLIGKLIIFLLVVSAGTNVKAAPVKGFAQGSVLSFIENKGQVTDQNRNARPDIHYKLAATGGLNIFIGNGAISYQFCQVDKPLTTREEVNARTHFAIDEETEHKESGVMYRMDVSLIGANPNAQVIKDEQLDYYERYFTHLTGAEGVIAHAFSKVTYRNIYPHIDWVLYVNDGHLKYDFVVRQGGDPNNIHLKYSGATNLAINEDGSFTAVTPLGTITEEAPYTYGGSGSRISSGFALKDGILGYEIGKYTGDIVVDPGVVWATYYGGSSNDRGFGVTTDRFENVYMSGVSSSTSNIATTGAYQFTYSGGTYDGDAYLVKFASDGARRWATYMGGPGEDFGYSVAADKAGNIFLGGYTTSSSGISSPGSHQPVFGGIADGFVAKFDSTGVRSWSTYYGGPGNENGHTIALDTAGNVYLSGSTGFGTSTSIFTPGAYQVVSGGSYDGYLVKFSNSGVRLWGTYYGGPDYDEAYAVTTDTFGYVYIAGFTESLSGIATAGTQQPAFGGGVNDAFLAKFNAAGVRQWGTYYGGADRDIAVSVDVDGSGNIFMGGYSWSPSGVATPGAYDTSLGSVEDGLLAKFNSSGIRVWATYFGGEGDDVVQSVKTDNSGNVYITGGTGSAIGVATPGAYQPVIGGVGRDCYVAKFNTGGAIQWGTYYGGNDFDWGMGVTTDTYGRVYVAGYSASTTAMATAGSYQPVYGGGAYDGILAKFDTCSLPTVSVISGLSTMCPGGQVTLTDATPGGTWCTTNSRATVSAGVVTGLLPGIDTILYTVANTCGTATAQKIVTINPLPAAIAGIPVVCGIGAMTFLTNDTTGGTWSSGTTGNATISATGIVTGLHFGTDTITYTLSPGCSITTSVSVNAVPHLTSSLTPAAICDSTAFMYVPSATDPSAVINWSRPIIIGIANAAASGSGNISETIDNITATPVTATYIYITTANSCSDTQNVTVTVQPTPILSSPLSFTVCSGVPFTYVPSSATTGTTYTWVRGAVVGIVPGPASGTGSVNETLINTMVLPVTGTYTYTLNANSCAHTQNVLVTILPAVTAGSIAGPDTVCVGSMISMIASVTGGTWSGSTGNTSVVSNIITGVSSGIDTVFYTISDTCGTAVAAHPIIVLPASACNTGVNAIGAAGTHMQLYPNPNNGLFYFDLSSPVKETVHVTVTDVMGRKVWELNVDTDHVYEIDLRRSPGIYIVSAVTGAGVYMERVVIE